MQPKTLGWRVIGKLVFGVSEFVEEKQVAERTLIQVVAVRCLCYNPFREDQRGPLADPVASSNFGGIRGLSASHLAEETTYWAGYNFTT